MEFVIAEETCARVMQIVKNKEGESVALMAAKENVFNLVSLISCLEKGLIFEEASLLHQWGSVTWKLGLS